MKTSYGIFLSALFLFVCCVDTDDEILTDSVFGKWKLVRMSASLIGSESTGDNMDWQEFYIFNTDSTFFRSQTKNGATIEENGIFSSKVLVNDRPYLSLNYPKDRKLAGSCYGNDKEELVFSLKDVLSSTWQACDGPGLDYQKVSN